ncbi:MAG: AAA family ATPase [Bacteroidales bacterium]|nr:AAA family ATPase [Bacteroidales bacterium]
MENLKMEINNGIYSCELNISKEEWLSVLSSPSCKQDYIDKLLLFCDEPDYTASCKHLAEKHNINAQAINSQITHFGMLASDVLNIHIERFEGMKETYWPLPMAKGRDTSDGLFEWTLRSELAEALRDYEIPRFKHLLEYFVAHLEYCDSGIESNHGYSTYIKPLLDSKDFKYTGRGYKGNAIQNQIKNWSEYSICDICINIQPNYGDYRTKKCYLNWPDTGINIYAKWYKSNVKSLIIGYCYWWNEPRLYEDVIEKRIDDLGLFDDNYPNDELKDFYNHFKGELEQYNNEEGKYFEKEKKHNENQKLKQIMADIQPKVNLLTTNYNLILTGAPGTGKTYLAKQIAQQMIFGSIKEEKDFTEAEKQQFKEQCSFVQFHPSYDYTDFVEGLRPIQDDNGNVGFERKDGVFKEFCKKAEKNWIDSKKSIDVLQKEFYNKELIDSFLSNAINEETVYRTKTGTEFNITDFDDDIISIKILRNKIRGDIDIDININKHKLVKLLENDLQLNNVRDIKQFFGYTNTQHRDSYIFTICNEIRNLPKVKSVQIDPIVCQNFVFIIDEINRGEISKIFGELFFSIDPGYRGKNGKVKTQYQNLVEVGDEFYDGFFVPENLYIIGTMNDIDRSVESMDFAFRRRFAFKEIKADESMKMLDDENAWKDEQDNIVKPSTDVLGKLKNRMNNLNNKIWHKAKTDEKEEEKCIDGLSSAYHIGAAYFLKLKNYLGDTDGGFENLWNNHLEGLLREYLRGSLNIEESIAKLKAAYNNESPENNG